MFGYLTFPKYYIFQNKIFSKINIIIYINIINILREEKPYNKKEMISKIAGDEKPKKSKMQSSDQLECLLIQL